MLLLQTTTEINDVEAVAEIDRANVSSLILWSGDHIALHLTSMEPDTLPRFQKIAALFNELAHPARDAWDEGNPQQSAGGAAAGAGIPVPSPAPEPTQKFIPVSEEEPWSR